MTIIRLSFVILCCLFLCLEASATTFIVTKTADTDDGVCNSDCSLREAIVAANSAPTVDIINFDPAVFNAAQIITLGGSELTIGAGTNLTINGPGPSLLTISGNNQSRVLFVGESAEANINGLKITGGNGVGNYSYGGGIKFFNFCTVNLNNVVITDNRVNGGQGGGFFIANATLTMTNSVVSNNRGPLGGGGIFIYESTVTLINSTVTGNVEGCGIQNIGGTLNLQSSTVSDNFTLGDGGGIDNDGGNVTLNGSIISGNVGRQGGGGISGTNGSISITDSTITNNRAEFFGGGGIKSYGRLTIAGSTISNNTAINSEGGGAIYNRQSGSTLDISSSIISGNTTTGRGGGIFNDGEGLNANPSLLIRGSLIIQNSASGKGGGVFNGSSLLFYNVTIIGNNSTVNGGGIANVGNSPVIPTIITNVTIVNNRAGNGGGVENPEFFYTRNSIVANNSATAGTSNDWLGFVDSYGYNLIEDTTGATIAGPITTGNIFGVDPLLGPLRDNGGPIPTLALRQGSPAIDQGAYVNPALLNDQRGFIRPVDFDSIPNAPDGNGSDIGAYERQTNEIIPSLTPFDFDGDGKTDIGIFRPLTAAEWWINRSSTGETFALQFGASTDFIAPADYTGDGKADIAFFRPASGEWYVLRSEDFSFFALPFGTNGDIPVPADYDADGKADFAVMRPSTSTWFISQSSGAPTRIEQFGVTGDQPVVSDYDGDGKADVGIFRPTPAEWWIQRSTAGLLAMQFGNSSDKGVQGDYTGDGKADVAIWRPSTGEWFIVRSEDFSFYGFPFGTNGDTVAPGDYDGDGKTDPTVFRPSSATWFIGRTTAGTQIVQFGATGDRPLPNAFVP